MVTQALYIAFLAVMALQRLLELRQSQQHAVWTLARGGFEVGQRHYAWMKSLHVAFFCGCIGEVVLLHRHVDSLVVVVATLAALAAQMLRLWAISTLGPRWNVRVLVLPGMAAESCGPYRFMRHPNYAAVIVEGIAVPMMHGAYCTAAVFSVLNLMLLRVRIRCEENALTTHCSYQTTVGKRPTFIPQLRTRRDSA